MNEMTNKEYIYKYFHWIIIFVLCISIPFIFSSLEKNHYESHEKLNDAIIKALDEDDVDASKTEILELMEIEEETKNLMRYKKFLTIAIFLVLVGLINFLFSYFGVKYYFYQQNELRKLYSTFSLALGIIEVMYLVVLLLATSRIYIGTNYWSILFINVILIVITIIIGLQYRYLKKSNIK